MQSAELVLKFLLSCNITPLRRRTARSLHCTILVIGAFFSNAGYNRHNFTARLAIITLLLGSDLIISQLQLGITKFSFSINALIQKKYGLIFVGSKALASGIRDCFAIHNKAQSGILADCTQLQIAA